MRQNALGRIILAPIGLALLLAWICAMSKPALASAGSRPPPLLQKTPGATQDTRSLIFRTWTPAPQPTRLVNLPMVKQDSARKESILEEEAEPTSPPAPTPTPLPVQTSAQNAPIVVGATIIVSIIFLAWLFLGRSAWKENT